MGWPEPAAAKRLGVVRRLQNVGTYAQVPTVCLTLVSPQPPSLRPASYRVPHRRSGRRAGGSRGDHDSRAGLRIGKRVVVTQRNAQMRAHVRQRPGTKLPDRARQPNGAPEGKVRRRDPMTPYGYCRDSTAGTTTRTPAASRSAKCFALKVRSVAAFASSAHWAITAS